MNDRAVGLFEGLSIARFLTRKYQKQPKRLLRELGTVMERLEIITAGDNLDRLKFEAGMSEKYSRP